MAMTLNESLQFVLDSETLLGELFYERLFSDYPELKEYFVEVDMHRQRMMLTMSLSVVCQAQTNSRQATVEYLRYLGTRHHDRGIPQEAYRIWLLAMLDTLEELHGERWSKELAADWTEAIEKTITTMFEGYENRYHV